MVFSYYPGCTLKSSAHALDESARKAAQALGFTLEELPEWQCCGAVYPQATNDVAVRLSSVRALMSAADAGHELVTLCSACHNVIKRVNRDMRENEAIRTKVNRYLATETPYEGQTNVLHYLEVLRDRIGFDALAKQVKHPLTGQKIGAYYGCLLLRPGREMQMDDPENPTILEDFIRAIGAEPVYYAQRNECCGGYQTVENRAQAQRQASAVAQNAQRCGAQMLVTACPLCLYNLTQNAQPCLPAHYFTELLARALGVE